MGIFQNKDWFSIDFKIVARTHDDRKYKFGRQCLRAWTLEVATDIQAFSKKYFFEFRVTYPKKDISTKNSK